VVVNNTTDGDTTVGVDAGAQQGDALLRNTPSRSVSSRSVPEIARAGRAAETVGGTCEGGPAVRSAASTSHPLVDRNPSTTSHSQMSSSFPPPPLAAAAGSERVAAVRPRNIIQSSLTSSRREKESWADMTSDTDDDN
jgi:hypothetical protein